MDNSEDILVSKPQASGSTLDQIQKLQDQISKSQIPDDLKERVMERVNRLSLLKAGNSSNYVVEYETTASYIQWVVNLPWNSKSEDVLDLGKSKQIFDKNHYGLDSIKNRILEYLASIILTLKNNSEDLTMRAPILCLVGLAGTGKTTLAQSIAQALGRKFERIPFGGMGDSRVLRGQSRAFADAEPGLIIKKLVQTQTKNCIILLDELDRVSESARSDIMGTLVELLDPEQNKGFTDHYIDYPFDLSQVLFVATANNTTNVSTAVLDRLEIIQMPSYSDEEKVMIAKSFLFPKVRSQTGLSDAQISISDTVWPIIIRPLGFDSGIRSLERTIAGICRKVARIIVEGKAQKIDITDTNVKDFLQAA